MSECVEQGVNVIAPPEPELSRRAFLKGILGLAAGATVLSSPAAAMAMDAQLAPTPQVTEPVSPSTTTTVNTIPAQPKKVQAPDAFIEDFTASPSYADTAKGALMVLAANAGLVKAGDALGIKMGNASFRREDLPTDKYEQWKADKTLFEQGLSMAALAVAHMVVVGPAKEEAIWRLAPSKVLDVLGVNDNAWVSGLITSALFATSHGTENKHGDFVVPLPQFNLGMYAWWQQRSNGYTHALFAHAINNAPALVIAPIKLARVQNMDFSPEAGLAILYEESQQDSSSTEDY